MIEQIPAVRRYQILIPVIIVENAEGLINKINPLPASARHYIRREDQIQKLQLRTKIGTAPNLGGA
jgi:hypothetical protein